jgi:RNA polymerase sigma-70 factor (family 1)
VGSTLTPFIIFKFFDGIRVTGSPRCLHAFKTRNILEHQDEQTQTAALRHGDEATFEAVFRQWYAPLCGYAARLTDGDLDAAEDLVQQVFVKLWEQRARLDIAWSLKGYLYKTVHNSALNRLRSVKTHSKYLDFNAAQLENEQTPPDYPARELAERLQQALGKLPPQCRHVFELSRFEDLKYREIADQLGISIKTVEAQMGKALRILRLQLADYLVTFLGLCIAWWASN